MAIRIEIKKLTPWQHDLADEIKVEMLNTIVEEYASEATKQLAKINVRRIRERYRTSPSSQTVDIR